MAAAGTLERARLHRRALWLETFTIAWNVIEAFVAVGAGLASGSVALVGFGVDSAIEVTSAGGLFWRLRKAGPDADAVEESDAERKALYIVAATFFALAAYIIYESFSSLVGDGARQLHRRARAGGALAGGHARARLGEAAHR